MATDRQIVKSSNDYEEAVERLRSMKDRKQLLRDALDAETIRIDAHQIEVDALLLALKTLVNEP
jgi:hypothetical protein